MFFRSPIVGTILGTVVVLLVFGVSASAISCPCEDVSLCKPVSVQNDVEIFGFSGDTTNYTYFDWDVITTIAWATDPQLICHAHANNARVIAAAPASIPLTSDKKARDVWVKDAVAYVEAHHLDGITFDYESPMTWNDPDREYYVAIINETKSALKTKNPYAQISVCVAWSPDDIDGRAYDVVGLADVSDLLYVMSYDTRSQIFDRCIASANSPSSRARYGLQRYLDLGIPPSKLILGTPWCTYHGRNHLPSLFHSRSTFVPLLRVRGVHVEWRYH